MGTSSASDAVLSQAFGLVTVVALIWALYMCAIAVIRRFRLRHVPLAPGSLPFLGHAIALFFHPLPWEEMHSWLNASKSNMVAWRLPFEDWVVVRGGTAMRSVFQTKFRDFNKEMALSFHPFLCILGSGLVTSHGDLWQKQRKLMTPAFKGDILQEVIGISVRAVDRLAVKLDASCRSQATVELAEEFRLLTLQVITEAVMSLPSHESDRVFPTLYLPIMEECHLRVLARWRPYNVFDPAWWRHKSKNRRLNTYINNLILERWRDLESKPDLTEDEYRDLLDLILHGKMRAGERWNAALQQQLCYELKTFLLAGHETSAAMLTYTLLELVHNSTLLKRALAEADQLLKALPAGQVPTRAAVEEMVFTEACLRETLRKYTVVPIVTRQALCDTEVDGVFIPRGTKVGLHLQGTHQMWQEPSEYRPDRFLPGGEFEQFPEDVRRFMFVPFGQGPRVCIGQHFSLMESRVVIAMLLHKFAFELQRPYEPEWQPNMIPLQLTGGVPMGIQRRA